MHIYRSLAPLAIKTDSFIIARYTPHFLSIVHKYIVLRDRKSTTVRSLCRPICLFISLSLFHSPSLLLHPFPLDQTRCTRFSYILLISYAIAAAMVVADWLGWWWWVHRVTTNKRVLSFSPFGRFISSYSASSFHRSIRVCVRLI